MSELNTEDYKPTYKKTDDAVYKFLKGNYNTLKMSGVIYFENLSDKSIHTKEFSCTPDGWRILYNKAKSELLTEEELKLELI